jgi:hypothetical protein
MAPRRPSPPIDWGRLLSRRDLLKLAGFLAGGAAA